jgi:hypothetical protein
MKNPIAIIELEITPIPPETIDSCKADILPYIEATLREVGRDNLLSKEHMDIQVEKAFPSDAAIVVALTLLSGIALETYKEIVVPALKKRFGVKEKRKRAGK